MKKRVFFAVLALFSFAAFFSCSNAAGGSDSESSKPSSASASKKPGYVTLTGTVSVSGAVPKILSDNYDSSSDNAGVSRSAQPGLDVSGASASMEYFATATCGGDVSEGVFGSGAEAKKFGLELAAEKTWSIVVGVRSKTADAEGNKKIYLQSKPWPVTPDPADPTISHNFVPVPNTSGGTGSIALKINYSPSSYEVKLKFVDGPSGFADLNVENWTFNAADGGRIYKMSSIPSGKYELCLDFKTTTSPQVLVYSTIQSVTVANGMQTDSWVADSSSSAVSPISAAGEFKFDSSAGGNAQALMAAFLGTNLFVGKVSDDCAAPSDTNSGNYLSPLKTVTGAVRKIAAAGNSNADYVIRVSGEVEETNSASPAVIQAISTSNAKSLTIIGTSGSDTDCIKSAVATAPAVNISTDIPITFKNIKILGSTSGLGDGVALNVFGGSKVTIDEGCLITGGKIGVNITGDSTKVTMKGGSFSGNNSDVYLESGKVLTVDGNLSDVADKGIVVSLQSWTRGTQFIESGEHLSAITEDIVKKFDFTKTGWDTPIYDSDKKAKIDADIYVAANGVDKDSENVENTIGNKAYPFKTIAKAAALLDASHGTIYVDGSVSGAQEIPASVASTCTAIKLTGLAALPTSGTNAYVPSDEINAGGAAGAGTALTVATSVPVTIENLKITGGYSITSYTGGGVTINAGSVTLSDGAWVSGNLANGNVNCGGGVYVKSEAKLFMRGKSLVGDKSAATNESGANNLEIGEGGGICNEGSVYIGCNESGVAETGYALADGYGVRGNWSNQGGAGIANLGTLIIASGEISYNATDYNAYSEGWGAVSTPGGGVYNESGSLTINGGKIYANKSTDGGGIYLKGGSAVMNGGTIGGDTTDMGNVAAGKGLSSGGGLAINTSCEFKMLGGTISHNSAKNLGGAVSASGTFTMSGGIISENEVNGLGDVHGGAVYVYGTFNLNGSAYIPSGVKNNSGVLVSGTGKNDVYLYNGRTVTVTGTLSPRSNGLATGTSVSVSVGALTPNEYKRGKKIVLAGSGVSVNENLWKKIALADNDGDWTKFKKTENAGETTEKNYVAITADVYVAGASSTTVSGVDYGKGLTTTEGGLGTKSKPFKFISDAVAVFEDASSPAVVTIVGTTYPVAQEIPDTFTTTSNASALTLKGLSSSSFGTIKRYTTAPTTADATGSALKVNSTVPVTIQDITITGGKTSGNGGGINIAKTGASVTLSSGVNITGNTAVNGGGVYVATGTILDMQSGTIGGSTTSSQNTASTAGGAIYQGGTFKVKGSATVYAGSLTTNDVYLAGDNVVTIEGDYKGEGNKTNNKMSLTPSNWKRGSYVLGGASCNTTNSQYFKITDSEWSVLYDSTHKGKINADIWVAGTYNSGTLSTGVGTNATGGKAPNDSNRGTKSQPYATIKKAVEQCWTTGKDFTIKIDGTLGGAQTVPAKDTTNKTGLASKIILDGNPLSNASSTAILNGGFASLGDDNHTLKIDTAVSVSIRNLKIIKGWATNGGGVYISFDSTVYMSGGVVVTENKATSGGGIANYGKLLIFGDARIGGTGTGPATASTGNYATNLGGGILNAGKLYLGYDVYTDSQNTHVAEFTGGITQNYAIGKSGNTVNAGKGGGIYNANGECVIKSGNVSYNYSWVGGGIYSAKTLTMNGGSIENNTATYSDDDSPSGGGVYAYSSTFTMSGGNISGNKASSHGGGVGLVGAKLYMYGSAVIGASAGGYATGPNACSNYAAKNGGGVYANDDNTSVLLGYTNASNVADTFDGGISYNCCGNGFNGGGIYYSGKEEQLKIAKGYIRYNNALNGYGGGICCNSKKCIISGGNIYSNHAKFGGGISLAGGSIEMSAGSIYKNSANQGGGGVHVSNTSGSSFTMSGGIIGGTSGNENTSVTDMGGAIYAQKDITFAGGASVPYNGTAKKNDVYLGNGIKIAVTGNNVPSASNVATIVPYTYNTTSPVMGSDSASAASNKFKVRAPSDGTVWYIETTGYLNKGAAVAPANAAAAVATLTKGGTLKLTGNPTAQQILGIRDALYNTYKNYSDENMPSIVIDLSGTTITSIPENAFWPAIDSGSQCNAISAVKLPTTVTSIGKNAFAYCSNMTSITGYTQVTSLGDGAFEFCSSLTSFTIPSGLTSKKVPASLLYGCGKITSISIPSGFTEIGDSAFFNAGLTSVTIPSSVTTIDRLAFNWCKFTSLTIPNTVTSLGEMFLSNNKSLTTVTLPYNTSVTKIPDQAFEGCSALKTVNYSSNITEIGEQAFQDCTALTSFTVLSSVRKLGRNFLWRASSLTSITFQVTSGWKAKSGNTEYSVDSYFSSQTSLINAIVGTLGQYGYSTGNNDWYR